MKKKIALALTCVALILIIVQLSRSKSIKKVVPDVSVEFHETADYYKDEVYKFKLSDFDYETKDCLLSDLVENFAYTKLDNENKDALLNGRAFPYCTESYIGMISDDLPYKLFDKATGKFLRNIGSIGQGPAEYPFISDAVIDEKNERIYITCSQMKPGILEYNLAGEFLEKIDISFIKDRKIKFTVNDSIITAFIMTFNGDTHGVVSFDKKGNIISSAPAKVFMQGNYDLEVFINTNTPFTGYSHVASCVYYNYDSTTHELVPAFAFDKTKFGYIYVSELNNCFFFSVEKIEKERYASSHIILYDKKTEKGNQVNLVNDYLGGIPFTIYSFKNGIYQERMTASDFREKAEQALKKNKLSEEKRKHLSNLVNSMSDDDNDIVFYGPLKKQE